MGQGQIAANASGAANVDKEFAAAHHALTSDPSIQFGLTPPDPPPQPPPWLRDFLDWLGRNVVKPLGKAFDWIAQFMPDAPLARFLMWTVLALAAAVLAFAIFQRLRHGQWRLPWRRRDEVMLLPDEEEQWQPDVGQGRSWLEEADALAAEGRFAEAIHHLLLRSVEDIASRRPRLVRPALTSRELAASDSIPAAARDLFARITRSVERTLFGGREVSQPDWEDARTSYADFALPRAWRA